jgi:hypothetical protein
MVQRYTIIGVSVTVIGYKLFELSYEWERSVSED